jgi:protein-tyrosine phosphatase
MTAGDGPLHIDWLAADLFGDGAHGRLGMTVLPGKHGASVRYPGRVYRRVLEDDLGMLAAAGVRSLVLLVEDHELARWGDPAIVDRAGRHGIDVLRVPVADGRAPRRAVMDQLLADLAARRGAGDVVIACMGGVGRTGMVAACALAQAGMAPDDAIAAVRVVRHPEAVETAVQEDLVRSYGRAPDPGASGG